MARRYVHEEPVSQLAIWARRMAFFALAAVVPRGHHRAVRPARDQAGDRDLRGPRWRLPALRCCWRSPPSCRSGSRAAPAWARHSPRWRSRCCCSAIRPISRIRAYQLPLIYDITTDPIDPPRYEALARVRPRDANPIAYAGLYAAEQQRRPIPDIGPLTVNATPQATYDAAYAVINKRKWRIVDARAPQAARREGRIEAVARTPDHGLPRRRRRPRPHRRRRRAHRHPLLVALRQLRFRRQRRRASAA